MLFSLSTIRGKAQYSQYILQADSGAHLILGYLVMKVAGSSAMSSPFKYLGDFYDAWKSHQDWCAQPPVDVVAVNYWPYYDYSGDERANPSHISEYIDKWQMFMFDGKDPDNNFAQTHADEFLAQKRFSLDTGIACTDPNGITGPKPSNLYSWQASLNTMLANANNSLSNIGSWTPKPKLFMLMNFAGWSNLPSECSSQQTWASSIWTPQDSTYPTAYGLYYSNWIQSNANFETGDLTGWSYSYPDTESVIAWDGHNYDSVNSHSLHVTSHLGVSSTSIYSAPAKPYFLPANAFVTAQVYIKGTIYSGFIDLYYNDYDANGNFLGNRPIATYIGPGTMSNWTSYNQTFLPHAGAVYARFWIGIHGDSSNNFIGDLKFDDVYISHENLLP